MARSHGRTRSRQQSRSRARDHNGVAPRRLRPQWGLEAFLFPERWEMYRPSRDEIGSLATRGNLVPVYREILADLETPVSAYLKIARGPGSFLLESVEGGERLARYSFLGTEPRLIARCSAGA